MMWVGHASHAQEQWFHQEETGFDCTGRGINMLPVSRGRCKLFSCKCEAISYLRQHLFSLESLSWVLAGALAVWQRMKICGGICRIGQMRFRVDQEFEIDASWQQCIRLFSFCVAIWVFGFYRFRRESKSSKQSLDEGFGNMKERNLNWVLIQGSLVAVVHRSRFVSCNQSAFYILKMMYKNCCSSCKSHGHYAETCLCNFAPTIKANKSF